MKFLHIFDILLLLLANFIVWSWALEEHPNPEIQPVNMEFV
jgi:hypothetical protein